MAEGGKDLSDKYFREKKKEKDAKKKEKRFSLLPRFMIKKEKKEKLEAEWKNREADEIPEQLDRERTRIQTERHYEVFKKHSEDRHREAEWNLRDHHEHTDEMKDQLLYRRETGMRNYSEDKLSEAERNRRDADYAEVETQQEHIDRESKEKEQTKSHLLVGAIDFGTTYSGWACSFFNEYKLDPTKASVKQWYSGSGSLTTEKTPTCVLVEPDGNTIKAFGYDAENTYKELSDDGEHSRYFYFRKFKMMLNKKLGEKLDRNITLKDEMGRPFLALDVFAMSIKYLKESMLSSIKERLIGKVKDTDVHWVLTVPAIWTDGAKQFMREAANKAGIIGEHLTIALEPEAASVYCRNLSMEATVDQSDVSIAKLKTGTKYMILDAGGGTIDITVHEVEQSGGVKEVHAACGGGWGGTIVDKAFECMLVDLFSKQVFEKFKIEQTEDWLDLWRDFEVKKRAFNPTKSTRTNMKFPLSLINTFEKETASRLSDALSCSKFAEDITLSGDKLKFSADLFRSLFDTSLEKTIGYVEGVIRDTQGVKAILMVGGFSESYVLQSAVKSRFPGIHVVIPKDASSAVLRGALIFGHSPKSITHRMLKYTYGIETTCPFEEGRHPESKRLKYEEGDRCDNIFSKHVEKNQLVKVGEPQVERSYLPLVKAQTELGFHIYASELKFPQYTDEGCKCIGYMKVKLSTYGNDLDRSVMTSLTFSGTEIAVNARETRTGIETSATIDFLG